MDTEMDDTTPQPGTAIDVAVIAGFILAIGLLVALVVAACW